MKYKLIYHPDVKKVDLPKIDKRKRSLRSSNLRLQSSGSLTSDLSDFWFCSRHQSSVIRRL
jgi:mRNA-degrading endonuclease RelE of RelBE toxin-antitoxin system